MWLDGKMLQTDQPRLDWLLQRAICLALQC
jgi:hypothetical protein